MADIYGAILMKDSAPELTYFFPESMTKTKGERTEAKPHNSQARIPCYIRAQGKKREKELERKFLRFIHLFKG